MAAWYKENFSFGPRNIFLTELIHCKYKNKLVGCLVTTDELCPVALYNIKLVFNSTLKFSSQSRPYSTTSSTLSPVNVEWDIIRFPQCEVSKGATPPPPLPQKRKIRQWPPLHSEADSPAEERAPSKVKLKTTVFSWF